MKEKEDRIIKIDLKPLTEEQKNMTNEELYKLAAKQIEQLNQTLERGRQTYIESLQQSINGFSTATKRIYSHLAETILNFKINFNPDVFEKTIADTWRILADQAEVFAKENLFLNVDMLDEMTFREVSEVLNPEWMMEWMEENLDEKINMLIADEECFGETSLLLRQSYEAYKHGHFAVATISLFPIIDTFVSHWHASDDGDVRIQLEEEIMSLKPKEKDKMKSQHEVIQKSLTSLESDSFELLFISYALNAYAQMNSDAGHYGFRRHHALHGSFPYSEVKQKDYIKLFFCLYTLYSVRDITLKKYMEFGNHDGHE